MRCQERIRPCGTGFALTTDLGQLDLLLGTSAPVHFPVLLTIGFAIFFGTVGAKIFQRLRVPQVVGYIVIGLILGRSGLGLIEKTTLDNLVPFNYFALGLIGFMIGGELHRDVFKKYGRLFISVLLGQGIGAFVLVSLLVSAVAMLVTRNVTQAVALGIMLGAISSATAPAATTNVLWEYKARGPLTTSIFAIVALDDGLALVLYSLAASVAAVLLGHGDGRLVTMLARAMYELTGGAALGVGAGFGLNYVLRRGGTRDGLSTPQSGSSLAFITGAVALVIGAARWLELDVILASMAMGLTLTNLAARRSNEAFQIVERFASPIYVLFFVFVGAHLDIQGMSAWMWALAVPFIFARLAGKILGAYFGARLTAAPEPVRKYLGLCLFCQGGVAVGLSIMAGARFGGEIGTAIIMIIGITTLIVELFGPLCVKIAIKRAGEIGLNVTEDDLAASHTVADVMDVSAPTFFEATRLGDILRTIAETSGMSYAVTDRGGNLLGVITLQDLKQSFATEGLTEWLVADDLMTPAADTITKDTSLIEAMRRMTEQQLDSLPVVAGDGDQKLLGILELQAARRWLSKELLRRHQLADGIAPVA